MYVNTFNRVGARIVDETVRALAPGNHGNAMTNPQGMRRPPLNSQRSIPTGGTLCCSLSRFRTETPSVPLSFRMKPAQTTRPGSQNSRMYW